MLYPLWKYFMRLASFPQIPMFSFPIFAHVEVHVVETQSMGALSMLRFFCLLTVYLTIGIAGLTLPLNQAVDSPGSLTMVSPNVTDPNTVALCTSSLIWTGSTGYDYEFTNDCYQAWQTFLQTDFASYKSIKFEFLHQGLTPAYPGVRKMATPRRYIKNSCTIAIANIADIPKGILPNEPPGPFPLSDLGRFSDFRLPISVVRAGCLGEKKELGWAVTGK